MEHFVVIYVVAITIVALLPLTLDIFLAYSYARVTRPRLIDHAAADRLEPRTSEWRAIAETPVFSGMLVANAAFSLFDTVPQRATPTSPRRLASMGSPAEVRNVGGRRHPDVCRSRATHPEGCHSYERAVARHEGDNRHVPAQGDGTDPGSGYRSARFDHMGEPK